MLIISHTQDSRRNYKLIIKTGNIAAVQWHLGHTDPAYSMKYARITDQELADVIDNR